MSGLLGMGGLFSSFSSSNSKAHPEELDAEMQQKIKDAGLNGSVFHLKAAPIPKVRIALFGLGNRGQSLIEMLNWLVEQGHAEITAISDVTPRKLKQPRKKSRLFNQAHLLPLQEMKMLGKMQCLPMWLI